MKKIKYIGTEILENVTKDKIYKCIGESQEYYHIFDDVEIYRHLNKADWTVIK